MEIRATNSCFGFDFGVIFCLFSLKTASEMHVAPWISYTVYKSTSGLVVPQTPRDHQRMLLNAKMLLYIQA